MRERLRWLVEWSGVGVAWLFLLLASGGGLFWGMLSSGEGWCLDCELFLVPFV